MILVRAVLFGVCLALLPLPAVAAQSFTYAAPACAQASGCRATVLAYDADSAVLAVRIGLPADFNPADIAISPDGLRVYVCGVDGNGTARVAVVDTTRHQLLTTIPVVSVGHMAASRDGTRLFVASQGQVRVYDVTTNGLVATVESPGNNSSIVTSPTEDRGFSLASVGFGSAVQEYDARTGAVVAGAPTTSFSWQHLLVSGDGKRVYITGNNPFAAHPASTGNISVYDPAGWRVLGNFILPAFMLGSVEAPVRKRLYSWDEFGGVFITATGPFTLVDQLVRGAIVGPRGMVLSGDETRGWMSTGA